jgi:tetratricopeptide (TPR) repeat protein
MNAEEILRDVGTIREHYNKWMRTKDKAALEGALAISLRLREIINNHKDELSKEIDQFHHLDGGLNAQIFNCMKLLGRYEDIIPYLEKTLQYLNNDQNPDLWRQLGLLYLVNENNLEKAVEAWKRAIALDSSLIENFSGLNVVYTYDAMKSRDERITWKILHADIETGEFSVIIGTE